MSIKKKLVLGMAEGNQHAFFTFNGSLDLAIIPRSETGLDADLPVRLQQGNKSWGAQHIRLRHGIWLSKIRRTVPELLYDKMHQCGDIYRTGTERKINIHMRHSPDSLLVFKPVNYKNERFLSLTTAFKKTGRVDGNIVGRYISDYLCINN